MFLGYMPGLCRLVAPPCERYQWAHMGTHGLFRLFSPPSISKTLRFLSRAANRPATTHPAEPPVEIVSPRSCVPLATLFSPPATIISTSSGIVMIGGYTQRCLWTTCIDWVVLIGFSENAVSPGESMIYGKIDNETPPSATWICGEMSTLHEL